LEVIDTFEIFHVFPHDPHPVGQCVTILIINVDNKWLFDKPKGILKWTTCMDYDEKSCQRENPQAQPQRACGYN